MGEALLVRRGGGGGSKIINGILQEYYAESDVVSADTFISFLENIPTTYLDGENSESLYPVSIQAIKMNDTKVMTILSSTYSQKIGCTVIELGLNGPVIGTKTIFNAGSRYTAKRMVDIAYIKPSDTDAVLFFNTSAYDGKLVGLWVSADTETNEVTVQANPYEIDSSNAYLELITNAIKLESNKFLIVANRKVSSNYSLNAYALQTNTTMKTVTVNKLILSTTCKDYGSAPRLIRMSEEQYCFFTSYGKVHTFNLDSTYSTVSNYLETQVVILSSTVKLKLYDICKISTNKAIVFFGQSSDKSLGASFITINNGVANVDKTISEIVSFSSSFNYSPLFSLIYYEKGKITFYINLGGCKKIIFEVNEEANALTLESNTDLFDSATDGTINPGASVPIIGGPYLVLPFTWNSLFMIIARTNDSDSDYDEAFKVVRFKKTAVPATSRIDGLTKNQLSTTQKGKVWTLE